MFEIFDRQVEHLFTHASTREDFDLKQAIAYALESLSYQQRAVNPTMASAQAKILWFDDGAYAFMINPGPDLLLHVNSLGEMIEVFDQQDHASYRKVSLKDRIVHLTQPVLRWLHQHDLERLLRRHATDSVDVLEQELQLAAFVNGRREFVGANPTTMIVRVVEV